MIERRDRGGDVGDHRLLTAAMAEILAQRVAEAGGIVADHRGGPLEPILAHVQPDRQFRHERSPLGIQNLAHRHTPTE